MSWFLHRPSLTAASACAWVAALAALASGVACSSGASAVSSFSDTDASSRGDAAVPAPPVDASANVDGQKSPTCAGYCADIMGNCAGRQQQYATLSECLQVCALLPAGSGGDLRGDSLECRAYFAGDPARTAPAIHCASAGPFGNEVCGGRCEAFCGLVMAACGADSPYGSAADCKAACSTMPGYPYDADAGEGPDASAVGNTLNCRAAVLRQALGDHSLCAALGAQSSACR